MLSQNNSNNIDSLLNSMSENDSLIESIIQDVNSSNKSPSGNMNQQKSLPPPQNNMPPRQNMPRQNMPQQNMAQQNMPQQNMAQQNMAQQNMARQNMARQNMAQQNMAQQNMAQQNMSRQNMAQQNMAQQNMAQQNMPYQNIPPSMKSKPKKQDESVNSPLEKLKKNIPEIISVILIGVLFNIDMFTKLFIFKNIPILYNIQDETITYTMIAFKALIMGVLFYITKLLL
jgi:hypothetical protein